MNLVAKNTFSKSSESLSLNTLFVMIKVAQVVAAKTELVDRMMKVMDEMNEDGVELKDLRKELLSLGWSKAQITLAVDLANETDFIELEAGYIQVYA